MPVTASPVSPYDLLGVSYAHAKGIFGSNITVAIIDTGIALHQDFFHVPAPYSHMPRSCKCRIHAFHDILGKNRMPVDTNGHGTHIAGIIGSCGMANGHYIGIAPACSLLAIRILDGHGNGHFEHLLKAIDWILMHRHQYHIRIVNISIGALPSGNPDRDDLVLAAVESLWDAGIIVVSAAGNQGPDKCTVTVPGTSPKIITVGAYDDDLAVRSNGRIVKHYSGRGPTRACVIKPEIVAPGYGITSCRNHKYGYTTKSGTSMATPFVSGAIALLLELHPEMTGRDVKLALYHSCRDLGLSKEQQGWGLLSIPALLQYHPL